MKDDMIDYEAEETIQENSVKVLGESFVKLGWPVQKTFTKHILSDHGYICKVVVEVSSEFVSDKHTNIDEFPTDIQYEFMSDEEKKTFRTKHLTCGYCRFFYDCDLNPLSKPCKEFKWS